MPPAGGTLNEFSCHYLDMLHGYAGALPTTISCDGGISVYHRRPRHLGSCDGHAEVSGTISPPFTRFACSGPSRADITDHGRRRHRSNRSATSSASSSYKRGIKGGNRTRNHRNVTSRPVMASTKRSSCLYDDFLACVQTGKKPDASPARATGGLANLLARRDRRGAHGRKLTGMKPQCTALV